MDGVSCWLAMNLTRSWAARGPAIVCLFQSLELIGIAERGGLVMPSRSHQSRVVVARRNHAA